MRKVLNDMGLAKDMHLSADVLGHLLHTKVISEDQLQSAFQAVKESKKKKKTKDTKSPFDESTRKRHIALKIYYDGAKYSGLAENVGIAHDNSVEKALFAALTKARLVESRESCGYSRCGRTDSGVSAAGQVVALRIRSAFALSMTFDETGDSPVTDDDLPQNSLETRGVWVVPRNKKKPREARTMGEIEYDRVLNNILPDDIRVLGWCPVSEEFSARFSATTRTYRYFFLPRHMNLAKMKRGLELMVGTHDFRNFCKMDVEKVYNFERKIHEADIQVDDSGNHYFRIVGQAFLWHQIRCIASILFMVGRGLEEPEVVSELLDIEKNPGKPAYPLASDLPLVLHECGFPQVEFGYSVGNLWGVTIQQERQWEDLILAAGRIRNNMNAIREQKVLTDDLKVFAEKRLEERSRKRRIEEVPQSLQLPFDVPLITWKEALEWLESIGLLTDPEEAASVAHTPLMERFRGTTYEEKIAAVQQSDRRRERYEENVIKKRKTKEEDAAFYSHMTKQGGSAH